MAVGYLVSPWRATWCRNAIRSGMMNCKVSIRTFIAGLFCWLTLVVVHADAQSVDVWLTTDNQKTKLAQQPAISFSTGSSAKAATIFVDETQSYQSIEGFGASFTDSAAYLLNQKVPATQLNGVMASLFDRQAGIGISFIRNPMGASDLSRSIFSYDDLAPGQADAGLNSFSIAHDLIDIVPLVKMALKINPQVKIMANPWSPPGWMKTSGSMIGGSLIPEMYGPFANYFVRYIQAYAAQSIPIDYISLQNEPLYLPADYPGMSMNATTQTVLLRDYVLPAMAANQLTNRILIYDHNWDAPSYPNTVLSDATLLGSAQVAGIAWHGYGGGPGAMMGLAGEYPSKGNYETEHSGGTWVSDQLVTDFDEIIHVMRSSGRSFVKWNLAGDQNDG